MSFPDDTGRARVGLIPQPHGGAIVPAWRLFVTACLFMIGASSAPVGATPPPQQSSLFIQGQTDRQGWESWFGALTGDYRTGAWYWSGQRSLPKPGSCNAAPVFTSSDWTAGCFAAQQKLAASDVRRKTEPDYRLGWNSLPSAPSSPAQTIIGGATATQIPTGIAPTAPTEPQFSPNQVSQTLATFEATWLPLWESVGQASVASNYCSLRSRRWFETIWSAVVIAVHNDKEFLRMSYADKTAVENMANRTSLKARDDLLPNYPGKPLNFGCVALRNSPLLDRIDRLENEITGNYH